MITTLKCLNFNYLIMYFVKLYSRTSAQSAIRSVYFIDFYYLWFIYILSKFTYAQEQVNVIYSDLNNNILYFSLMYLNYFDMKKNGELNCSLIHKIYLFFRGKNKKK